MLPGPSVRYTDLRVHEVALLRESQPGAEATTLSGLPSVAQLGEAGSLVLSHI